MSSNRICPRSRAQRRSASPSPASRGPSRRSEPQPAPPDASPHPTLAQPDRGAALRLSKPYSPDTHPEQIKEQLSDKQYLELYNAAQWCYNLTPNWAATVPLPPGAVTPLPRADNAAATITATGAAGAAGAAAAAATAAAVATAVEAEAAATFAAMQALREAVATAAEAEAAATFAAVAVDRSRSTAAAAAPAASDAGTGGSAALVPSPPQPRCTGVPEIAHEIEQSALVDGPADPQGFRARWTEVCHRRRKHGGREVAAHE